MNTETCACCFDTETSEQTVVCGLHETREKQANAIEVAARALIQLLRDVGNSTNWADREQTDRVFAWYEFDGLREALGEAEGWGLDECQHEAVMTEWVSVEDSLPDEGIEVLCTWTGSGTGKPQYIVDHVYEGRFVSDGMVDLDIPKISHWMLLPPAPTGRDADA